MKGEFLTNFLDLIRGIKDYGLNLVNKKRTTINSLAGEHIAYFPLITSSQNPNSNQLIRESLQVRYFDFIYIVLKSSLLDITNENYFSITNDSKITIGGKLLKKFGIRTVAAKGDYGDIFDEDFNFKDEKSYFKASVLIDNPSIFFSENKDSKEKFIKIMQESIDNAILDNKYENFMPLNEKSDTNQQDILKSQTPMEKENRFSDIDFKTLKPLLMEIKIMFPVDSSSDEIKSGTFYIVIGVFVSPHIFTSEDIIENVCNSVTNESEVFNFLRWTTGEIKFWKDFVFQINRHKEEIQRQVRTDSKSFWFNNLIVKKINLIKRFINERELMPTTILALNIEESKEILKRTGINLESPKHTKRFLQINNLLTILVYDEITETMAIFNEETSNWENFHFRELEREMYDKNTSLTLQLKQLASK